MALFLADGNNLGKRKICDKRLPAENTDAILNFYDNNQEIEKTQWKKIQDTWRIRVQDNFKKLLR